MKAFARFVREEPVRSMAILNALIVLSVAFGAKLSWEQIGAITTFAAAILGTGSQITRAQVAPIAKLSDAAATEVRQQEKAEDAKP